MKKKILIALAAILLVNQSSRGEIINLSSITNGETIDYFPGSDPQLKNDYSAYVLLAYPVNTGILAVNIPPGGTASIAYAGQFTSEKRFYMRCIPDTSLIVVTVNGSSATISGIDPYFAMGGLGMNMLVQGPFGPTATYIGDGQTSYTVTGTGTVLFTLYTSDHAPFSYEIPLYITFDAHTITTSSNPADGGTTTGSGDFGAGTTQTVTATANPCFAFVNWTENGNILSTDSVYTFTLDEDRNLVANFEPIPYTITLFAYPDNGGSLSGSGVFDGGSEYTVTATPNPGFTFWGWFMGAEIDGYYMVSGSESYTFTLTSDIELMANFAEVNYALTVNSGTGSGSYTAGTVVNISANTAPSGQTFDKWTGDVSGVFYLNFLGTFDGMFMLSGVVDVSATTTTFTLGTTDATITATYKDLQYTITASAGAGGTISPSGEITVNQGASQTFTATPDQGKMTDQWLVNATAVQTGGNSYTVSNVQADATLEVTFKDNGMTIQNPESSGVTFAFKNGTLTVKSESAPIQKVEAYNLFGQLLKAVNGSGNTVEIGGLPVKQILIVKVVVENGEEIRRKIMD